MRSHEKASENVKKSVTVVTEKFTILLVTQTERVRHVNGDFNSITAIDLQLFKIN